MRNKLIILFLFFCSTLILFNGHVSETIIAAPETVVRIAEVSAPDINCVFDTDCVITVNDTTDIITLPLGTGSGFLQTRTWPVGEPGTQAEGLYGYEYRIDVRGIAGTLAIPCVSSFQLSFPNLVPLDYDGDSVLEEVFVVTSGGIGTIQPFLVDKVGDNLTFTFAPSACAGSFSGDGDSTFFIGLTSTSPPVFNTALLAGSLEYSDVLQVRTPDYSFDTLYGIVGEHLSIIDTSSMIATPIMPVPGFSYFEGLTFHESNGYFYTIANTHEPRLVRINMYTETVQDLGLITLPDTVIALGEAIAYHPLDGKLYASLGTFGSRSNKLVVFENPASPQATFVSNIQGVIMSDMDSLVYADGYLYANDTFESSDLLATFLYRIDNPATGDTSFIGQANNQYNNDMAYITSPSSNTLYKAHHFQGLGEVSIESGAVNPLGHVTAPIAGKLHAISAGPKPPKPSFAFAHTATSTTISGHKTLLDHPDLNADPDAKLIVTQNWNPTSPSGVYNNHVIGVMYEDSRWHIFNQDDAAIPVGASFNVLVEGSEKAYVHIHGETNGGYNETLLNHPVLNNESDGAMLKTAVYNPSQSIGIIYNETTYPGYHIDQNQWAIFKEQTDEFSQMPYGTAFNVFVPSSDETVYRHQALASNIFGNYTYLDHPLLNGNPNAVFFANAFWDNGLVRYYQNTRENIGVWYSYSTQRWAIFNQDTLVDMAEEAQFIVYIPDQSKVIERPLTLWHAWDGIEADLLESLATTAPYANISIQQFASHSDLLDALESTNSDEPDLIVAPDMLVNGIQNSGFGTGYCLPGQCPACEGPNPPHWCPYAGGDFSKLRNQGFLIHSLCGPDGCVCSQPNPPRWCIAAGVKPEIGPDIFQAAFSDSVNGEIYPIGYPISWDSLNIGVNVEWFVANELSLPSTTNEILALRESYPDLIHNAIPEASFQAGGAVPDFQTLFDAIEGEPNPDPMDAGLLLMWSSQYAELSGDVGQLILLPFDGYASAPIVEGIIINGSSPYVSHAVEFARQLATVDFQQALFENNGRLPTNPSAWYTHLSQGHLAFGESNLLGWVNQLPEIDIPQIIDRPTFESPEFDDSPCGGAAAWFYEQFLDAHGITDTTLVIAEFEARQIEKYCERYMPDFGRDDCSIVARHVFAQRYAELRGHPNAYSLAKLTAHLAYSSCQFSWTRYILSPSMSHNLSFSNIGNGLTLNLPANLHNSSYLLIVREGTLDPYVDLKGVIGVPFSINIYDHALEHKLDQFAQKFLMEVSYDETDLDEVNEEKLALFFWDNRAREWVEVETVIDVDNNTITAELDQLTTFAIRPKGNLKIYLPIVIR